MSVAFGRSSVEAADGFPSLSPFGEAFASAVIFPLESSRPRGFGGAAPAGAEPAVAPPEEAAAGGGGAEAAVEAVSFDPPTGPSFGGGSVGFEAESDGGATRLFDDSFAKSLFDPSRAGGGRLAGVFPASSSFFLPESAADGTGLSFEASPPEEDDLLPFPDDPSEISSAIPLFASPPLLFAGFSAAADELPSDPSDRARASSFGFSFSFSVPSDEEEAAGCFSASGIPAGSSRGSGSFPPPFSSSIFSGRTASPRLL